MLKQLKNLIKDEEAPTAVEYALMVAGVGILMFVGAKLLGGSLSKSFDNAGKAAEIK